jgi:hypothetical protein
VPREAENWLYATGNHRRIPSDGSTKFGVFFYHNILKKIRGLSPTPYSKAAEYAGYSGIKFTGLTQAQLSAKLKAYCNVK